MASEACKTVPAVAVASAYKEQGRWTEIDGMRTYTTGPSPASKAILIFYDVFGFHPQTLQGADILASQGWLCVMPDFFRGRALSVDMHPPRTEEQKEKVADFRARCSNPALTAPKVPGLMESLRETYPNVQRWGALGFCWGGKIVSMTCAEDSPFVVGAQSSPAAIEPAEGERVSVPMCVLASGGEEEEKVKAYKEGLEKNGKGYFVERREEMVHGWMSARGGLGDENVRREYERGYQKLVDFFGRYL